MQPNLTLKNGRTILLSDEIYEAVLRIVEEKDEKISPADSIEDLEAEFAELFVSTKMTTDDLLREHAKELEREKKKSDLFS